MKINQKNSCIWKFTFEKLSMKEILRIYYKLGDLLYEFPAETRLTVYRRLDITRRAGVFPMESNTKTIGKRAGVEPRTQMHVTMKKLFWIIISSISSCLESNAEPR